MAAVAQAEGWNVKWNNKFSDKTLDYMGKKHTGDYLPWSSTHNDIRLRMGEVTLWAGINGHKKSMMLMQAMLWLSRSVPVGAMSFELPVAATNLRMAQQAAGCYPSKEFVKKFCDWGFEKICHYEKLDTVPRSQVLGAIHYMATEKKCKHIAIDSLMMIDLGRYEDKEKQFMEKLVAAAKTYNIHIHLVAHMRKPPDSKGDSYKPTRFDVLGDSNIVNKVDNLFIVWENKKRKNIKFRMERGLSIEPATQEYFDSNPDQQLIVAKQRFGRFEGPKSLYFHDESLQFISEDRNQPMEFDLQQQTQSEMEV